MMISEGEGYAIVYGVIFGIPMLLYAVAVFIDSFNQPIVHPEENDDEQDRDGDSW